MIIFLSSEISEGFGDVAKIICDILVEWLSAAGSDLARSFVVNLETDCG